MADKDELEGTGLAEVEGMTEEDGKFYMVVGNGTKVEMPEDAWRSMKEYRKGLGIED